MYNTTIFPTTSNWFKGGNVNNALGTNPNIDVQSNTLLFYGSGHRLGSAIVSIPFNIENSEVYLNWKPGDGSDSWYSGYGMILTSNFDNGAPWTNFSHLAYQPKDFTTHHSFSGSIIVSSSTWYCTKYTVNNTDIITHTKSTSCSDFNQPAILDLTTHRDLALLPYFSLSNLTKARVQYMMNDNYGSTSQSMEIGAITIVKQSQEIVINDSGEYVGDNGDDIFKVKACDANITIFTKGGNDKVHLYECPTSNTGKVTVVDFDPDHDSIIKHCVSGACLDDC